jgi:2-polyprenyl-3-methyl-5-hydroxy-6-metoxy-1,4-benzoquinol methylase
MSSSPTFLDPIVIRLLLGDSVLDVGCGYGRWGSLIRSNFWEASLAAPPTVDGIDAFGPNVDMCLKQGCYRKVWQHVLPQSIEGKWDTVLACEVIEHVPQADVDRSFAVLEASAQRRIIISTPNFPDYRPGGETLTGINDYEAHRSYVSRDEFSRRGYTIVGAGFGNQSIELTQAIIKFNPSLVETLQSLSRAFPVLAHTIVAYKDMDAPASAWNGYGQSLAGPSLHDLRIATVGGRSLAYDPVRLKLVGSDELSRATVVLLMKGDSHAVAVSAAQGLLTFTPHDEVHSGTRMINAWELLRVGETVSSSCGFALKRYCDLPIDADIELVPPPLGVAAQPWFGDLLQYIAMASPYAL